MTGAHPKTVQAVMRHSTITLTMDTYGHLFPGQEAETVARFPGMLGDDQADVMKATGTDDQTAIPSEGAQQYKQQQERERTQASTNQREGTRKAQGPTDDRKPLRFANQRDEARHNARKRRGGDSNPRSAEYHAQRFSKPSH